MSTTLVFNIEKIVRGEPVTLTVNVPFTDEGNGVVSYDTRGLKRPERYA